MRLSLWILLSFLLVVPGIGHGQSVNIDLGAAGQAGATARIVQLLVKIEARDRRFLDTATGVFESCLPKRVHEFRFHVHIDMSDEHIFSLHFSLQSSLNRIANMTVRSS